MGSSGQSGLAHAGPVQIPVQAQSNTACCPDWARNGQAGLARSNPARAPAGYHIRVASQLMRMTSVVCDKQCKKIFFVGFSV